MVCCAHISRSRSREMTRTTSSPMSIASAFVVWCAVRRSLARFVSLECTLLVRDLLLISRTGAERSSRACAVDWASTIWRSAVTECFSSRSDRQVDRSSECLTVECQYHSFPLAGPMETMSCKLCTRAMPAKTDVKDKGETDGYGFN